MAASARRSGIDRHGFDDQAASSTHGRLTTVFRRPTLHCVHRGWSINMMVTTDLGCTSRVTTLGETSAIWGLEVAYSDIGVCRPVRRAAGHDGLTGDQRFFIAYGYSWETSSAAPARAADGTNTVPPVRQ
jgi:hypothetical protein